MELNCKLEKYIEKLDRQNSDLKYGIDDVCGVTNAKELMKGTRANLIGRTFEKFTILAPREFIFNRRTSRNGEKISLGFNNSEREYILTEDYCHFRVKKELEDELMPEYLYLFFLNPEFDRYARFNSWGSATEFFNWDDMKEVPIFVPDIKEQRKIVEQFSSLSRKIEALKEQEKNLTSIINVAFENVIQGKEKKALLGDILHENPKSKIQVGMADLDGIYPFFTSGDTILRDNNLLVEGFNIFLNTGGRFDAKFYYGEASYSTDTLCVTGKDDYSFYLYCSIMDNFERISSDECFRGSALKHLKKEDMKKIEIYGPSDEEIINFNRLVEPIFKMISLLANERLLLENVKLQIVSNLKWR